MILYAFMPPPIGFYKSLVEYTWTSAWQEVATYFDMHYAPIYINQMNKLNRMCEMFNTLKNHDYECIVVLDDDWAWNHNTLIPHIKNKWPNSKIVITSSDLDLWNFHIGHYFTMISEEQITGQEWYEEYLETLDLGNVYHKYQKNNKHFFKWFDFINQDVDLLLDPNSCITHDASKKWESRQFIYNVSTPVAEAFLSTEDTDKEYDGICLAAFGENDDAPRWQMKKCLDTFDYKLLQGGNGEEDNHEIESIRSLYHKSKVCIGTSTRGGGTTYPRGSKGFRDWIAPLCDIPLIYDDFTELNNFDVNIPTYEFFKWEEIVDLTNELYNDKKLRKSIVEEQREFSLANTLDKQLINIFNDVLFSTE